MSNNPGKVKDIMLRKISAFFLVTVLLFNTVIVTAMADPNTDNIVIKKGENSDNVILLQLRLQDLGYYNYKITGFFGDFTASSLKSFQKTNSITADGIAGEKTLDALYNNSAKRLPVEPRVKPTPPKIKNAKYGSYRDWFNYVNARWPKGTKCKVIDFDTGKSYYVTRVGGQYHADVAPSTKHDNTVFKSTYGGEWSWERRAVIVYIQGEWIAGSTNGMPHGSTGVPGNGMNTATKLQQVCIHFLNSRTHIHNMRDPDHQYQVKRAAGLVK
jgi:peptidoglycan hydrolase-like protein with peptidoglycan-binding domain